MFVHNSCQTVGKWHEMHVCLGKSTFPGDDPYSTPTLLEIWC